MKNKKHFTKIGLLILLLFLSYGCAGTGVLLEAPPFEDKIPEFLTGFYSVNKIENGKVSTKHGSEFLGDFVYLYKDDYFKSGKYFSGIKGSFLPNRIIRTSYKRKKLKFYWFDDDNSSKRGEITFDKITEKKLAATFVTDKGEKESYELVFYKHQLQGDKMITMPLAHRGVSYQPPNNYDGIFPANTIPAFEAALRSGFRGFELDVRITKDNRFVVSHDENLSVSTTAIGLVGEKNLSEIENALVVKSAAIPENRATAEEAYIAAPIVSLKKVLDLFINNNRLKKIVIDIKPDTDERIAKAAEHDFKNFTKEQQQKILFLTREESSAKVLRKICPYSDIALEGSIGPEPIEDLPKFFPEEVGLPRGAHNAISFGANIILAFKSAETAKQEIARALELSRKHHYKIVMWTFARESRLDFMRENKFFPDFILLDLPYYKYALQQLRYIKENNVKVETINKYKETERFKNPIYKRKFNQYVKDFWFKSRTTFGVSYGVGKPRHTESKSGFSNLGNLEINIGRSEVDVFSKTNLELNETFLFWSMFSQDLISSHDNYSTSFKAQRLGIGKTDGFGYVGSVFSIIPYVAIGLTWTKINNFSATNECDKKILDDFKGNIRFGDREFFGIKAEILSHVHLNLNYETGVIFPRHKFFQWLGSFALMEAGYLTLAHYTSTWIDKKPVAGPIVNTLFRAAYLFGYYLIRKENMYWPFPSEPPLRYDAVNFGINFIF